MLAYQWHKPDGVPVVFLHGLLGSQQDWAEVLRILQKFPQIRPLTLDLPYHQQSRHLTCDGFPQLRLQLDQTLTALIQQRFYLVGYSLGGRAALDYAIHMDNPNLCAALLEGANIGLETSQARANRWQNDQAWARRFRTEPIAQVLADWYQQPVFADLTAKQRQLLQEKRKDNCGNAIAQMLEATSLAKQEYVDFATLPAQTIAKLHFIIGENDRKFRQMAQIHRLPHTLIPQAGHNSHWENPEAFVAKLVRLIK